MSITEAAIRQAAIELIGKKGFEAMTLRGLADRAGVNASTLYLYYEGKQDLLATILHSYYEDLLDTWLTNRPVDASAKSSWAAFVTGHVTHHLLNPQQVCLGGIEQHIISEPVFSEALMVREDYIFEIEKVIRQGVSDGSFFCPDIEKYANILFGIMTVSEAWYLDKKTNSHNDVICKYLELTLKILETPAPDISQLIITPPNQH